VFEHAHPGDDRLSALASVHEHDTDRLSEAELVMMAGTLVSAGCVTTPVATGIGTILLGGPRQFSRLAADPARVATAVEEVLGYQAANGDLAGAACADLALAGVPVAAGAKVVVSLAAANRDPSRLPEPDHFDVTRGDNPHLSFGHGIHHCLSGAPARVKLRAVLTTLTARLPDLRVVVPPERLRWQRAKLFGDQWPETVPVTW
jgi:cytochrome P450